MSEVTKPVILDETGVGIKEAILSLKTAIENQSGDEGGVDLSAYYTKTQTDEKIAEAIEGVVSDVLAALPAAEGVSV